ncbi:MAG: cache domain-containing protein [Magnetospirillum sp.]|nr:cache domain-containing protein [Magnetospirillum sp.]
MFHTRLGAALLGALLLSGPVMAAETKQPAEPVRPGFEDVQALVDDAVAFMKKVGPEKAFAAFNDPKCKWIKGELYIFAFDAKGVYMATGFRPERTGSNSWEMTDAAGLKVVQEIIKKAKRNGSGLVDYLWKNPTNGKLENKTSYVVQVGDYVIGAGFYHR